ncbi:hypothetical protein [Parasphingorhabdus flavimaris]|jgi:ElaB/YqjD/DUF883 family membrane-anchored ribosome-binding protein|uniref:DUF883 family protein n=1 Tax=Parasphingorhabdus flavimaris TaxID=266812 RepID=A0ABX2N1Q4_9SPHN|nr:hypothetical protein [Parasphingorhabdus flavimaris]NVD27597.1 hypothetical protein [Parasphingorhabdus flavimaris]|tara:strand:+ start:14904 stop:15443 length:540 start_codon:yes stop_codon:yes gene_type:complete
MSKLTDNIDKARAASRERFETARDIASESTVVAREKMSESKARAAALLGDGREKAAESVAATREAAKKAAARSEETITNSPLTIVAAGAALGVLVGALLPKSKTEGKFVGGAGRKINETAKTAYQAAKDASRDQISEMGLSNDNLRNQFKDMFGKAIEAAKTAMAAAQDAVKEDNQGKK